MNTQLHYRHTVPHVPIVARDPDDTAQCCITGFRGIQSMLGLSLALVIVIAFELATKAPNDVGSILWPFAGLAVLPPLGWLLWFGTKDTLTVCHSDGTVRWTRKLLLGERQWQANLNEVGFELRRVRDALGRKTEMTAIVVFFINRGWRVLAVSSDRAALANVLRDLHVSADAVVESDMTVQLLF